MKCVTSLVDISSSTSSTLAAAPVATSVALAVSSVVSGGFSVNMMMCLMSGDAIKNMQYLNLNHSNIALTVYSKMGNPIVPNWIAEDYNTLDPSETTFKWGIFETGQVSALYLDNLGDDLTQMMIYVGIYLIAVLFSLSSKIEHLVKSIGGTTYVAAFGFLVSNILGPLQTQVLFGMIQIINSNMNLDLYCKVSIFMAYLTMAIVFGLLFFGFFRVRRVYKKEQEERRKLRMEMELELEKERERELEEKTDHGSPEKKETNSIQDKHGKHHDVKWIEKKYEFMFGDFKNKSRNTFFFAYWLSVVDVTYALILLSLQSVPILQCFAIFFLLLGLIVFSAIIKPFKQKGATFLFFWNFACVLAIAFLNLILTIIQEVNPDFSGKESQGWAIVAVIILNTGVNIFYSLGGVVIEIYHKIKKCRSRGKVKPGIELESQEFSERKLHSTQQLALKSVPSGQTQAFPSPRFESPRVELSISGGGTLSRTSFANQNFLDQPPVLIRHDTYRKKFTRDMQDFKLEKLEETEVQSPALRRDQKSLSFEDLDKIGDESSVLRKDSALRHETPRDFHHEESERSADQPSPSLSRKDSELRQDTLRALQFERTEKQNINRQSNLQLQEG